jgi:hypothetical protein
MGGGRGQMPFQYFSSLRIVFDAELKKGQLTQQKYFLNDYLGVAKTRKQIKTCVQTKLRMFLN